MKFTEKEETVGCELVHRSFRPLYLARDYALVNDETYGRGCSSR